MKGIRWLAFGIGAVVPSFVLAQPASAPSTGFYGGVTLRDRGTESARAHVGSLASPLAKVSPSVGDEGSRALLYGGYRRNEFSVEASFNARELLTLTPEAPSLGLALAEPATRAWNLDVYTSWEMRPSLALYGRLGYGQVEPRSSLLQPGTGELRHPARDGVNYGVGLRFDITRSLGLRMEYARFARPALTGSGDPLSSLMPDTDQVSIGVQLRF